MDEMMKNNQIIIGNSVDIDIDAIPASEIKADVVVNEYGAVRIWGQIKDCKGRPIENALVKLLKINCGHYHGIAHTVSDCQGFYQFDVCKEECNNRYKILVGKANTGKEKVINTKIGSCDPCKKQPCYTEPMPEKKCQCQCQCKSKKAKPNPECFCDKLFDNFCMNDYSCCKKEYYCKAKQLNADYWIN